MAEAEAFGYMRSETHKQAGGWGLNTFIVWRYYDMENMISESNRRIHEDSLDSGTGTN